MLQQRNYHRFTTLPEVVKKEQYIRNLSESVKDVQRTKTSVSFSYESSDYIISFGRLFPSELIKEYRKGTKDILFSVEKHKGYKRYIAYNSSGMPEDVFIIKNYGEYPDDIEIYHSKDIGQVGENELLHINQYVKGFPLTDDKIKSELFHQFNNGVVSEMKYISPDMLCYKLKDSEKSSVARLSLDTADEPTGFIRDYNGCLKKIGISKNKIEEYITKCMNRNYLFPIEIIAFYDNKNFKGHKKKSRDTIRLNGDEIADSLSTTEKLTKHFLGDEESEYTIETIKYKVILRILFTEIVRLSFDTLFAVETTMHLTDNQKIRISDTIAEKYIEYFEYIRLKEADVRQKMRGIIKKYKDTGLYEKCFDEADFLRYYEHITLAEKEETIRNGDRVTQHTSLEKNETYNHIKVIDTIDDIKAFYDLTIIYDDGGDISYAELSDENGKLIYMVECYSERNKVAISDVLRKTEYLCDTDENKNIIDAETRHIIDL